MLLLFTVHNGKNKSTLSTVENRLDSISLWTQAEWSRAVHHSNKARCILGPVPPP